MPQKVNTLTFMGMSGAYCIMLYNNLNRLMAEKAIASPAEFMQQAGFSYKSSLGLRMKPWKAVRLDSLEKLCIALKCTPNDLLHWVPDTNSHIPETHPIHSLKKDTETSIQNYLQKLSSEKLKEVKDFIRNLE